MRASLAAAALLLVLPGCVGPKPDYDPDISPEDFVEGINNPWFLNTPGATWTYTVETDEGTETITVTVLEETRDILDVAATVVRDTVTLEGELVEDTYDWYAQDRDGNVWYLGEDSTEYEGGRAVSTAGSWEWGTDGALPGVIMWADPQPGEPYFQEFYWREAIDEAQVIATGRTVVVPAGTFSDTVTTREWTRLERGVEEEATYARSVGPVLKAVTRGDERGQREELVSYSIPGASA